MPSEHHYYVYLLTSKRNTVLYVGVTNDLKRRIHEHRKGMTPGFTSKYNVHKLLYFEETRDVHSAIAREKEIKKWSRIKKNALIETANPGWNDLSAGWFGEDGVGAPRVRPASECEISRCARNDRLGEGVRPCWMKASAHMGILILPFSRLLFISPSILAIAPPPCHFERFPMSFRAQREISGYKPGTSRVISGIARNPGS